MFIIKYYIVGALISLLAAIYTPQIIVSLLFLWISLSLALVSVAYVFDIPSIFRKTKMARLSDGFAGHSSHFYWGLERITPGKDGVIQYLQSKKSATIYTYLAVCFRVT